MIWQPIKTAPRDGSVILLHAGGLSSKESYVGYYDAKAEGAPRSTYPYGPFVWRCLQDGGVAEDLVTHWMPLPEPPNKRRPTGRE